MTTRKKELTTTAEQVVFQPFKKCKKHLSLLAAQKQVAGWIWPSGDGLPTPALDCSLHCIQRDP